MTRSTFSTTTMASSTSKPIASTMANMVKLLMEYPAKDNTANVPNNTTGTAIVGIKVALKFCKNKYIMMKTNTMASIKVLTTPSIDFSTNGVVS